MSEESKGSLIVLSLVVTCIVLVSGAAHFAIQQQKDYTTEAIKLQKEAIQHGYARYNPTNANFEWLSITNK